MKVSVIVPVYNSEKFIADCIESVLNQTYQDFELILIDDGSTDSSGIICDKYCCDSRVKVLHKQNGGVSSARNVGLQIATGDWLLFLDSDDELRADCLQVCISKSKEDNLDMLQFCNTRFGIIPHNRFNSRMSPNEFFKMNHFVCIGGSFIRKEIVRANDIYFDEHLKLAEDQIFILRCIHFSRNIEILDKILYVYRYHGNNASSIGTTDNIEESIRALIRYKSLMPYATTRLDNTILSFIGDLIRIGKMPESKIKAIYKYANVRHCKRVEKSKKLFYYFAKFNLGLAILVLKKYYRK